jgi:hypothetical protein
MLWKSSVYNKRNWRYRLFSLRHNAPKPDIPQLQAQRGPAVRSLLAAGLQAADAIGRERRGVLLAGYPALAVSTILAAVIVSFCLAFPAAGHEREHPELNGWYESLRRPYGLPCCSRRDCHRTDAELRHDGWYARLGMPIYTSGQEVPEWRLIDPPVHIPDGIIVKDSRGRPVNNPEGEAVICHQAALMNGKADVDPATTTVWCFVPPGEY